MRFLLGCFLGSALAATWGLTIGHAWFKPSVESYPEYRRVSQNYHLAEADARALRLELAWLKAKVNLDELRRRDRDATNPGGEEVSPADLIPAPKEPFPLPTRPQEKAKEKPEEKAKE